MPTCVPSVSADKTRFSAEILRKTQALPGELVLLPLNTRVVVSRSLAGTSPASQHSGLPINTVRALQLVSRSSFCDATRDQRTDPSAVSVVRLRARSVFAVCAACQ